jgi:hypothetical protein
MIDRYDPTQFRVELNTSGPGWTEIAAATFSYSSNYDVDENNTLIIGTESASISVSVIATSFTAPVFPTDQVRATYKGSTIFSGIVDTTKIAATAQSGTVNKFRYDFSATLVDKVGLALARIVCYDDLPKENALTRIQRWVTVEDYS